MIPSPNALPGKKFPPTKSLRLSRKSWANLCQKSHTGLAALCSKIVPSRVTGRARAPHFNLQKLPTASHSSPRLKELGRMQNEESIHEFSQEGCGQAIFAVGFLVFLMNWKPARSQTISRLFWQTSLGKQLSDGVAHHKDGP